MARELESTTPEQQQNSLAAKSTSAVSPDHHSQTLLTPGNMEGQVPHADEDEIEARMATIAQEANAAHHIRLETLQTTKQGGPPTIKLHLFLLLVRSG
jgi:hypothetical protein